MPDLDLLRELAPPVEPPKNPHEARARVTRSKRKRPLVLASPIAVGAVIVALLLTQGGQEFATAAVRAAEASPRLLVDGWEVTRVDEWSAGNGEMTFSRDGRALELRWEPEPIDRKELQLVAMTKVAGAAVWVGRYPGTDDYTALWADRDAHVLARGTAPSPRAFVATLQSIERASAEDWLRALPKSAIAPKEQTDTIASMLEGIPLPPGFEPPAESTATRDRYQLGAAVAGAVVCGWIERWMDGDPEAAKALATSRDWPLLNDMNADGDYPEVVWQYADAINGKGDIPAGKLGLTVDESYRDAFGC